MSQERRRAALPWVFALIMGAGMTAVISGVLNAVNGGNLRHWLLNWLLAWSLAVPIIVWLAPRAQRLAARIVLPPTSGGPR
ncbi:DUF2798 domain-containing protein [Solimonas flava]|uniref:DUF2798 domain-containing protein n=1 Tax=Solimonas flava TaxID=415849 RepID=UPI000406FC52|nr:DUF2798 domain-containing protein [Solimonas flava]